MPTQSTNHFRLTQSLRGKFILSALVILLLVFTIGATAIYAVTAPADEYDSLMEEHLVVMKNAQKLVGNSILIERQIQSLIRGESRESAQSYIKILELMDIIDLLVEDLGQTTSGTAILDMHQVNQVFRNTIHIIANLRSELLNPDTSSQNLLQKKQKLKVFENHLDQQIKTMLITADELSSRISFDYRQTLEQAKLRIDQTQKIIASIVIASLIIITLTGFHFYFNTMLRLQTISLQLRQNTQTSTAENFNRQSQGDDEISTMARSVQKLLIDQVRTRTDQKD